MRVYRLIAVGTANNATNGIRDAHVESLGVFSTTANAEAMIRIHAEKTKEYATTLGYALYENELDDLAMHGPWKGIPEFLSVRTYFADGTPNAFCDCDDTGEKKWHGRDADTIRYRRGDFVSVWHGKKINTELIGELPVTTERKITGDWTDDCYFAYTADGSHDHPFTPYVFPLIGKLTANVKMKLEAAMAKDEEANE